MWTLLFASTLALSQTQMPQQSNPAALPEITIQQQPPPKIPMAVPINVVPAIPAPTVIIGAPEDFPRPQDEQKTVPAPKADNGDKKDETKDEKNGEKKTGDEKKKEEPLPGGCLFLRLGAIYWRDIEKLQGPLEKKENCENGGNGSNGGNGEAPEEEKPRRPCILPPPFKGTPFPSEEFLMVHPIGVDLEETWPLMKAIYAGPNGDAIKESRIKVYGWVDVSANVSTSRESNLPDAFNIRANKIELDQAFVRIERLPDTVQQDHVDWGFRLDNFYGIDYRYTTAKGIFSTQLIQHDRLYGDDPIMFYGELYFPQIGEGTLLKAGRFILLPGIEADTTVDNYMFSHSVLYTYFPYTHTGVLATTMLNKNWTVQYGFVAGSDIALWSDGREGTFITGFRWVSDTNNDSIYACTITNSGNQTYNNVQMMPDIVWTHKFCDRVHMVTEAYYNYMKNVPPYTVFTSPDGMTETNSGWTVWYGAQNYFEVALTKKSYVTLRTDFMQDVMGQRTGFKTPYLTEAFGYVYKPYEWLWYRPEIRWSHSFDTTSYDQIGNNNITGSVNGQRHNQVTLTFDALFRF